ncbi:MAG: toll/interleukin-1 receptor domain-containing protein [Desulfobacterales bacterium]|nr:toll/interleukin-1 receptor domain-containing protein [Desulfobacterales bacterium]
MIFISYASEDRSKARQVVETLRDKNAEVWFDERDIPPTSGFVREIEKALAKTDLFLCLWSRCAAASRWVQLERDSAIARRLNGAPIKVVMGRLDDTATPPLFAAERGLDLRLENNLEKELSSILIESPRARNSTVASRVDETEISRSDLIEDVVRRIPRSTVVVLGPRKSGGHSFTRQLQAHLSAAHPDWNVAAVPVQRLVEENVSQYLARMRALMGLDQYSDGRIVVCAHGWSANPEDHQRALAIELRVLSETRGRSQPVSIVAVGSHSLYLLRYSNNIHSIFSHADQVDISDFDEKRIHDLMEMIDAGRWSREDAGEVWRRSGGHPHLIKNLLRAWCEAPGGGWSAAEGGLKEDNDFVLPQISRALSDDDLKQALRKCVRSDRGMRWNPLDPNGAGLRLFYKGVLRRDAARLIFRCNAIRELITEFFGDDA